MLTHDEATRRIETDAIGDSAVTAKEIRASGISTKSDLVLLMAAFAASVGTRAPPDHPKE